MSINEGFAFADDWLAEYEDAMAERGWYRALDADEKPISIGDAVEHNGVVANVLGITFHGTTPPTVCICRGDYWVEADTLHHHRPDTWESIITDAMRAGRADVAVNVMPLIKRCKALCERTREGEE